MAATVVSLVLFATVFQAGAAPEVCPRFQFAQAVEPELSAAEIKMICGFEVSPGSPQRAWSHIPVPQAVQALRASLQQRGYHDPKIEMQSGFIHVTPGEKTLIESVEAVGSPEGLDVTRKRGIVGEILTPALLDELEAWSLEQLQNLGYPCPEISSQAGVAEQKILLNLNVGKSRSMGNVFSRGVEDPLRTELTKFYAFQPAWGYRRIALELTSSRMVREGIVESAQFVPVCSDTEVGVIQDIVPGEPRLFSVQFAFNTEEAVRANARLVHREDFRNRLLLMETALLASLRIQQLSASARWFAWSAPSRLWWEPRLLIQRLDEDPFEMTTEQFHFLWGGGRDFEPGLAWEWRVGPAYALYQVQRGPGPDEAGSLSLRFETQISSHENLFYMMEAQRGWNLAFTSSLAQEGVASDFTARTHELSGEATIPIGRSDPPILHLGIRGRLGTTVIDGGAEKVTEIPPNLLHYLGGIDDLRGFTRLAIPYGREEGGLTRASLSLEARAGLLAQAWEPLAFIDVGAIGRRAYSLDRPLYWSPGVGVKWNSPVGPIRVTIANGLIENAPEEIGNRSRWQAFLSWGETF